MAHKHSTFMGSFASATLRDRSILMASDFNNLETAIIKWFIEHYTGTPISMQLKTAQFISREWTKAGFYVNFKVEDNQSNSLLNSLVKPTKIPVEGPAIIASGIEHGAGSLLWGQNGFLNCLEMYSNGGAFAENILDFSLQESGS
jgi:hypothetical protein